MASNKKNHVPSCMINLAVHSYYLQFLIPTNLAVHSYYL